MALTICSQFLADIGRTEAISSSSLHFSNQSNSRRSESFTFCSQTNSLPLFEIKGWLSWPVGLCENGADLSRELNPIKYQHLVRYSPQRDAFSGRAESEPGVNLCHT